MGMVQFVYPGGRFKADATTVEYLMDWAYRIQPVQHSGGPDWMHSERYDIQAKASANASEDEMRTMVQTLLAERFKLQMHRETKKMVAYVIAKGKGEPRLYAPKEGEAHSMQMAPVMGPDQKVAAYRITATRYSLAQLTDTFARQIDRVIVNETGMNGEYDFTLEITPSPGPNPIDVELLLTVMREQLGLSVTSRSSDVDFYAIEGAERVKSGTDN